MTNQAPLSCIHCIISGKVQGVWFRAGTKQLAEMLGLTGYAKNLPNGDVEVIACGKTDDLEKLKAWLNHGPELARVDKISCEELNWRELTAFKVG